MFRVSLFGIAKKWKQHKCLVNEQINQMWYTKQWNILFSRKKEGGRDSCSSMSRVANRVENLKNRVLIYMECLEQKQRQKQISHYQRWRGVGIRNDY